MPTTRPVVQDTRLPDEGVLLLSPTVEMDRAAEESRNGHAPEATDNANSRDHTMEQDGEGMAAQSPLRPGSNDGSQEAGDGLTNGQMCRCAWSKHCFPPQRGQLHPKPGDCAVSWRSPWLTRRQQLQNYPDTALEKITRRSDDMQCLRLVP